jgi:flagellar biosynthesis protein FlhB
MIEWFIWDPYQILIYTFVSICAYAFTYHEDLRDKVKYPKLVGLAVSLASFFEVGMYCTLTVGLYFMCVMVIDLWIKKFKEKQLKSTQ